MADKDDLLKRIGNADCAKLLKDLVGIDSNKMAECDVRFVEALAARKNYEPAYSPRLREIGVLLGIWGKVCGGG